MSEESNFLDLSDDSIEFMSESEAKTTIDKVMREARDPTHPFSDGRSPDHKRAVEQVMKLRKRATPEIDPADLELDPSGTPYENQPSREMIALKKEMAEETAARQDKRRARMQEDMDTLVEEYEYQREPIPDDAEEWQENLLHAERLNAEGTPESLNEFSALVSREARTLGAEPELMQAIDSFNQARAVLGSHTAEEFREIGDSICHIVSRAYQARKGE